MNRVKLSWLLPVLGVLALGGVFLRCVDKEVDEPMRWRNALDIPFSFSMPLDSTVTNAVRDIMNGSISTAVPNLESDGQDSLISIILGDTALIGQVMEPDFEDILSQFIKNDSTVRGLLEGNNLKVDDVAADVAKQVDGIQQEVNKVFNVPFSLPAQTLSALNMDLLSVTDPVIETKFKLVNGTPLKFTLYVLFFEDEDSPIKDMSDDRFLYFIETGGCERDTGCVNLFYGESSGGMAIDKGGNTGKKELPPKMDDWLSDFIFGTKSLVWRWMAVIDGEPGEVLKALGGGEQQYYIDAELNIRIVGTNSF